VKVIKLLLGGYIWFCALSITVMIVAFLFFLIKNSIYPLLNIPISNILSELFPAIIGSIAVTLSSVAIASPVGIMTGIFINEYTNGRTRNRLVFIFKVMGGIPSIVIGIFGFIIILVVNRAIGYNLRPCLFVSSLSLALLILPYIVHSTVIAFRSISLKEKVIGLSLGVKKHQNIFYILFPKSLPALFSGIILAVGRAAVDTAVIMLTGVAAMAGMPSSLLKPYEALPFYIYLRSSEYRNINELSMVYIAAVIIIIICIGLLYVSNYIHKRILIRIKR